jgi:Flp pilus assembly protein TadD
MKISLIVLLLTLWASCGRSQSPVNGIPFYVQGQADFRATNYTAAISNFSRCIELDPHNAETYCRRAVCKCRLGNYAGAVTDYNRAIQNSPRDSDYYCYRGQAKAKLDDLAGAIADYTKGLQLDANSAMARTNLATAQKDLAVRKTTKK